MSAIRYTLLANGGSDRALLPLLDWLMRYHLPQRGVRSQWADLARLASPPSNLIEKIRQAADLYPCDLIFIHRDSEGMPRDDRTEEIRSAVQASCISAIAVPVVPVRMTEAWLLFDEAAIRRAAGNPNGHVLLQLPTNTEGLPDPKATLRSLLTTASELPRRRLKRFPVAQRVHRVAQLIQDYSPLRALPAFNAFEAELQGALRSLPSARQGS